MLTAAFSHTISAAGVRSRLYAVMVVVCPHRLQEVPCSLGRGRDGEPVRAGEGFDGGKMNCCGGRENSGLGGNAAARAVRA